MVITRSCVLATALSIASMGIASAASLATHTDVYNAGGIDLGSSLTGNEVNWTFNILDDGYNPATESITSATISISVREITSGVTYNAEAELSVAGKEIYEWNVVTGTQTVTLTSFITLDATGKLTAMLEADDGIFYFDQAKLIAHDVSAVPVPAAVWLFGSGLLGLAGFARARQKA